MNIEEQREQEARAAERRAVRQGRMDLVLRGTEQLTHSVLPARDAAIKWRRTAAKLAKAPDTPAEVQPGIAAAIEIADAVITWGETMERRVPEVQGRVDESTARVLEASEVLAAARRQVALGTLDADESRRRREARDAAEDAVVHLERKHVVLLAEGRRALSSDHAQHLLQAGIATARRDVDAIVSGYRKRGATSVAGDMSRAGRGIESAVALGFAFVAESEALAAFDKSDADDDQELRMPGAGPRFDETQRTAGELAELFAHRRHYALDAIAEKALEARKGA